MKKLIPVLMALVLLVAVMAVPASAASASYSASASASTVTAGETFTVTVSISGDGIAAAEFTAIAENATIVSGTCGGGFATAEAFNASAGKYSAVDINETTGSTVTITCQANSDAAGKNATVSIGGVLITDIDGNTIGSGSTSVAVNVACATHDFEESVTTPATCTAEGVKTLTCTACGYTTTETIPMVAHTPETIPAVAATCTEAGATEGTKCAVCGEIITAPETVPALGHEFGEYVDTKAATCTEAGEKTATCIRCDATTTEEIPAAGHVKGEKVEIVDSKEATETEDGYMIYVCAVCGEQVKEVIPAKGVTPATDPEKSEENTAPAADTKTSGTAAGTAAADTKTSGTAAAPAAAGTKTSGTAAAGNKTASGESAPKTGDETNIALWAVVLMSCIACTAAAVVITKKHNKG